jgi:uroporphyrinogen-III synthase
LARRIFISKNASEVVDLDAQLKTKGDALVAHSFLHYAQIEIDPETIGPDGSFDVIFFGSPRAVFFYKAQFEIPASIEIACVGAKTAEIIKMINREVAFQGIGSIQEVADSFKEWCGTKKVLFPISTISLKTISSTFDVTQKIEAEVYETTITGKEITPCDIYVFTSPSNVEGFLKANTIPQNATTIAWGESTENALRQLNIEVSHVLAHPSLHELESLLNA